VIAPDPIRSVIKDLIAAGHLDGWNTRQDGADGIWSEYTPKDNTRLDTGFKLHVSAGVANAGDVLARTLPIITRMGVAFKHASTVRHLASLSSGVNGVTQVGKFLTAYPSHPQTARRLAYALHEATQGLEGPRIRSEAALFPDSLVHYRYGAFSPRWLQLPTGQIVPAREGLNGLEVDDRAGSAPSGIEVPFDGAQGPTARPHVLHDRYICVQQLYHGPKGSTWLGISDGNSNGDLVVVKEAYAHVMEAGDGLDARQRLRWEAQCLIRFQDTGVTPKLEAYWEEERSSILVYGLVEGPTFAHVIDRLATEGLRPPSEVVATWTIALCGIVAKLHVRGVIVGDIKPANLVLTDASFHLIDLELMGSPTEEPSGGMGTRGYCSPQQIDPLSGRSYVDDVYAIGATMLAAVTLTDASLLPDPCGVARLESRRHPGTWVYPTIERCLASERHERFPSVAALSRHVAKLSASTIAKPSDRPDAVPRVDFLHLARRIGDALLHDAIQTACGAHWVSNHPTAGGQAGRDLYTGSAGTALFLCQLHEVTEDARYLDLAVQCGNWLQANVTNVTRQIDMPGLYYGDCGPGLLYLKLYGLTGDDSWLELTHLVSQDVAKMARHSPDLMTGSAGTGIFHLALWRVSGERAALDRALGEAVFLLDTRTRERPTWVIPEGHDTLSGREYIGFSHGSAGIGYFLAECGLACRDSTISSVCVEIADWMIGLGRPCLDDESGLMWSSTPDGVPSRGLHWCHGSAGIARFLLSAYAVSADPAHARAASRAGRMLALGAPWAGTTQCHGIAGNAEVLIDLWACLGDDDWLSWATMLGENLALYETERGWPSEDHRVVSPDLMVGQAGVGAAFVRLGRPRIPHLVSVGAFDRAEPRRPGNLQIRTER
jgi:hypothetical protein